VWVQGRNFNVKAGLGTATSKLQMVRASVWVQQIPIKSAAFIYVDVICHAMKDGLDSLISRPCYLDNSLINRPISKSLCRSAGGSDDEYSSPPQSLAVARPQQIRTPYSPITIRKTSTFYAIARGEYAEARSFTFIFPTYLHKKSVTQEMRSELITTLMTKAQVVQEVTTCQLVLSLTQGNAVYLHRVGTAP